MKWLLVDLGWVVKVLTRSSGVTVLNFIVRD